MKRERIRTSAQYTRKKQYSQALPKRTTKNDVKLLKEYGFRSRTMSSSSLNLKKIDGFGMRQLDRLKMLLLRNEHLVGQYPSKIRHGIDRNDLNSFAEALVLLSTTLKGLMS